MRILLTAAVVSMTLPLAAHAQMAFSYPAGQAGQAYYGTKAPRPVELAGQRLRASLVEIREQGLELRRVGGGALSDADRAALQRGIDAAYARYASLAEPGCLGTRIRCNDGS